MGELGEKKKARSHRRPQVKCKHTCTGERWMEECLEEERKSAQGAGFIWHNEVESKITGEFPGSETGDVV